MSENASLNYEAAAQGEDDFLQEMRWKAATRELRSHLSQRPEQLGIAATVSQHLGLRSRKCANDELSQKSGVGIGAVMGPGSGTSEPDLVSIWPPESWVLGSFNLCIPVRLRHSPSNAPYTVMMRCPLPHKLAEDRYPGTVDEKMRCEVAAYLWIRENCPEVPIPNLLGFGFPGGSNVGRHAKRPSTLPYLFIPG